MYFVVEWIIIAAPWSKGLHIIGAAVLSTIRGIPSFLPISATSLIGKTCNFGFGNVSAKYARVLSSVALAKSLGSPTHLNVAKATMQGLLNQRTPDIVAKLRGKKASEVAPPGLVAAYENTKAQKKVQVADES